MNKLNNFFNPKAIAVVGASNRPGSVGGAILSNIVNSKYKGTVFPVNIKGGRVKGLKAYKSISEIKSKIDLVVIVTPAFTVVDIVEECGLAGVKGISIISSGFSETGDRGAKMSEKIANLAKKYGMRILGPNCLGFINPRIHLNASFSKYSVLRGNVAVISQSGALCSSILDWSRKNNLGFSYFVSVGEMLDIGFHDLIDYFSNDSKTDCILLYMESLKDSRKFLSAARKFGMKKPIVVLKSGRSSKGAKAAKSHTGSLAGDDEVFSAAFERSGIIRVNTITEFFHLAKVLSVQPITKGNRIVVITNAGGPGVLSADAIDEFGGELVKLPGASLKKLNEILPASWSHGNPVDILGDATKDRYREALEVCLENKNVDAVLIILTPQAMTDPSAVSREIVKAKKKSNKIVLASWMGGEDVAIGRQILEKGGVSTFETPEEAIRSFMYIYNYSNNLKNFREIPFEIQGSSKLKINENNKIIDQVVSEKRVSLNEMEARNFLMNYDIPVSNYKVAKNSKEAGLFYSEIGYSVAMKILSPDIIHKIDVGGVRLNVGSKEEAIKAYDEIIYSVKKNRPDAKIEGIIMEAMVDKKYELIIGAKKDEIFGPVIVFGMGGSSTEVFKDTVIGFPPLDMDLAFQMISKTKIYQLLKGYRGMPKVDVEKIQFLLCKFSRLLIDFPIIKELDINPFSVDESGGVVLDVKVLLDEKVIKKSVEPYSHLSILPVIND